jgi:hypothetical protein
MEIIELTKEPCFQLAYLPSADLPVALVPKR